LLPGKYVRPEGSGLGGEITPKFAVLIKEAMNVAVVGSTDAVNDNSTI
jgi:hypothetical protein